MSVCKFLKWKKGWPLRRVGGVIPFFLGILVILIPVVYLTTRHPVSVQADWSPSHTAWEKRQQLNVVNSSSVTLHTDTTIAISIDTKSLAQDGLVKADCSDLRVIYQPDADTYTELPRYLSYPGGGSCVSSSASKVYFSLQEDLASSGISTDYYVYYGNKEADVPTDSDDAFDMGSAEALLVCPFDGTTTCAAGETPSTESGAIRYSAGKSALSFDGVGDYVRGPVPMTVVDNWTIEAWVYTSSATSSMTVFQVGSDPSSGGYCNGYRIGIYSGVLQVGYCMKMNETGTAEVPLNSWNHIAAVRKDGWLSIFLNGVAVDTDVSSTTPDTPDPYYGVGNDRGPGWTAYYNGFIDEVRASNIVRYTSDFVPQTTPFVRDEYTKLLLHFDENGDDPRNTGKAIDDSGNGNHGTITGAKYVDGIVGISESESNIDSQAYASHEGIFIEEGTTNKITNPSFEHETYDTNWIDPSYEWWLAGGISSSNVLAVYQPLGASSYANSLVNIANPGTRDATEGVAPVWSATSGWTGDGSTTYLKTNVYSPGDQTYSAIAKFTNVTSGRVFGGRWFATDAFSIAPAGVKYISGSHTGVTVAPALSSGTLAIAGNKGYRNGVLNTSSIPEHSTASGANLNLLSTHYWNQDTTVEQFLSGNLYEVAFFNNVLSDDQVLAVYNAMTWAGSGITVTENTVAPYYKFGSKSMKLVTTNAGAYVTTINAGNTNTHTLSAYVYDGTTGNIGGTVSSSIAKLVFNGSTVTPDSYTDMGGGWWRLSYSAAAVDETTSYGVEVQAGKTIYLDGVQLEEKDYATTYADGSLGTGYAWSGTENESTSTRTAENLSYDSSGNVSTTSATVSFWYKALNTTDELRDAGNSIHFFGDSDSLPSLSMTSGSSPLALYLDNGGSPRATGTLSSVCGNWYYIVFTWDTNSNESMVCVNNSCGSVGTAPSVPLGSSFFVGSRITDRFVNSTVSDLRIYDTALDSTEISDLYYAGLVSHQETAGTESVDRFNADKGQNPMAVYHFDEEYGTTTYDSSTNLNHLTISGATWTNTVSGKYLKYDGTNDYLYRSFDKDFDFATNPFSISGMLRHPSTVSGTDTLLARQSGVTGYKVYMNSSGYLCFSVNSDSTCTTTSLADSRWHHFEAVRDTTTLTIYIDGEQASQATGLTATTVNGNNTLYIGIDDDGSSNPWDGFIDELVIYPYARDASQVLTDNLGKQISVSMGARTDDNLTDGLVGWWKMDEASWNGTSGEVVDSSGNGNHGTAVSGATTSSAKYGNGGSFDGGTKYVNIGDKPDFDFGNRDFTVSTWAYRNSGFGLWDYIVLAKHNTGGAPDTNEWGLSHGNSATESKPNFNIYSGTTSYLITSPDTTEDNCWYHLVGIRHGEYTYLYVNGELKGSQHIGNVSVNNVSGRTLKIAKIDAGLYGLDGYADDARVYNRALSHAEVTQLYEYAPGPVAYWQFDEGMGTSAYDSSGNGNTGTLTNGPTWTQGKYGKALSFDGSDDYVEGGISVLPTTGNGTFSFWAKITSSQNGTAISFNDGNPGDDNYLNIYPYHSGTIQLSSGWKSWAWENTGVSSKPLNTWHYYTYVIDDQDMYLFCNGIQIWSEARTTSPSSRTLFRIGNRFFNSTPFAGEIDDLRIYNYARTQKQIISDMLGSPKAVSAGGGNAGSAPVAYYKFDEGYGTTAYNYGNGGSSLNGTLTNMSSPATSTSGWTNDGRFEKALNYDGSNDYVSIGDAGDSTSEVTLSAWVKLTNIDSNLRTIMAKRNGQSTATNWGLDKGGQGFCDNNEIRFYHYNGAWKIWCTSDADLVSNTWYHILVTYNGTSSPKVYLNSDLLGGAWKTNYIGPAAMLDNNYNASIGALNDGTWGISAAIDEVRIYNYALSPEEVKLDYNRGSAMVLGATGTASDGITSDNSASREYCVPGDTSTCNPPVAEWKFDEGSGTSAYDTSGNDFTATLSSDTEWVQGKFGKGLAGNGTDYLASVSHNSTLNLGTTYTIEGWVKANNTTSDTTTNNYNYSFLKKQDGNSGYDLGITKSLYPYQRVVSNTNYFTRYDDTSNAACGYSETYDDGCVMTVGNTDYWDEKNIYRPAVIKDGDTYKLWYSGYDDPKTKTRIGCATSSDGVTWTRYDDPDSVACGLAEGADDGCVLNVGASNFWDDENVYIPTVIKQGNIYKIWYSGGDGSSNRIGYATSSDGISWEKYDNPGSTACGFAEAYDDGCVLGLGSNNYWDDASVHIGGVMYDEGNALYKLWYSGYDGSTYRIGYATSVDGINWNKYDNPGVAACGFSESYDDGCVFNVSSSPMWDYRHIIFPGVAKDGNTYLMDYQGLTTYYYTGLAFSSDGITWSRYDNTGRAECGFSEAQDDGCVMGANPGSNYWDWGHKSYPSILIEGSKLHVYYSGYNGTNYRLGLSILNDGVTSSDEINADEFNHIAGVRDGENIYLYVNGKLDSSTTTSAAAPSNTEDLLLGDLFNGTIDEIKLYDYARTPAQIAWEYNRGAPVGWWKFDECSGATIYDYAPDANGGYIGNNGTLTVGSGGTQTSAGTCGSNDTSEAWNNGTTGHSGPAMSFDGVDDYVTIGSGSLYDSDNGSFSTWIKTTASGAVRFIVADRQLPGSTEYFQVWMKSDGTIGTRILSTHEVSDSVKAINDDNWHHIIVVWGAGGVKQYIDGYLDGSNASTDTWNSTATMYLGASEAYLGTYNWLGQLDDAKFFNYALTGEQVKLLYNEGATVKL